jgi:hypothetical protein
MHYVKEKENERFNRISFAEQNAQEKFDIVVCKSFHICSNAENAANKSLT